MQKNQLTIDSEELSKLLEFPGHDFYEILNRCELQVCRSDYAKTSYYFKDFMDWVASNDLGYLRSIYIETFRLNRHISLRCCDYLCEQDLMNQRYVINQLEKTYSNYPFERSTSAPDSIPEIIRFASLLKDSNQFESILCNYALHPILHIRDRIEESNPYRSLLSFVGDMLALEIGRTKAPAHFEKPVHPMIVEVA